MRSVGTRLSHRALPVFVSGPVVLFLASACGLPTTGPATPSRAATSRGSSSSLSHSAARSSSLTAAPASGGAGGRCLTSQLSVRLVQIQGAAGSVTRTYEFTNEGATACTLYGYPGFQLLGPNGQKLSTTVARTPAPESSVTLVSGGHAWFTMQYPNRAGYGNLSCPTSAKLEVTPPNAYDFLTVAGQAGTIQAYGGTTTNLACGTIRVQPVTATPPSP